MVIINYYAIVSLVRQGPFSCSLTGSLAKGFWRCGNCVRRGFLQSEALGEVSILEGGSSGRSFCRSFPRSFSRSFQACLVGTFRARKTSAKTSAQNSHDSAQQNRRNFREKLHGEVLQGGPRQTLRKFAQKYVLLHQERVRKFCGKFAEISRNFVENYLQ